MANELDDAFDALPEAPPATHSGSLDAEFDALPDVPTSAPTEAAAAPADAPVSAFRAKVGLSDPYAGDAARYAQQRADQEDLVRKAFKPEPGLDPDIADAKVAKYFEIPLATVKANRTGWLDTYAKASGDARKWIDENPLAARLIFEHPEHADDVVSNKEQNILLKGLNKVLDLAYDFGIEPLSGDPEQIAKFRAEKQAQLEGRAARDTPHQVVEKDTPEARAIRQEGPLAIGAQRARESRAGLEVSVLYTQLGAARGRGQDTSILEAKINDAEERARGLALGETGWTQALSDTWAQSQSSLDVLEKVVERGGAGAAIGLVGGAVVGGAITKTPAGAASGALRGAKLGMKIGGAGGAAERSFTLEFGDSYKTLLSTPTDSGKLLTEPEARGGALIAASVKTGIELAELALVMKALGPAGAVFEKGGLDAVKAQLATNPGVRALAVKAAKAWVGEGVEEVTQGMTDDVTAYLVKVKHDNPDAANALVVGVASGNPVQAAAAVLSAEPQKGPIIDVEARKQDFTMGLLGGLPIGLGSFVVAAGTHAIFQDKQERAATQGPAIAKLAVDPGSAAKGAELADLIAKKSGETGFPVTHAYFEAADFKTFFQTSDEAEKAATETMGEAGAQKLVEAEATGARIAVPVGDFISNFGKVPGLAEHLSKKLATTFDGVSEAQLEEKKKADEVWAKSIADEARKEGASPTLDKLDALEQQLVATGKMTKAEAKDALQPMRDTFQGFAKRFGQSAEDLFRNVRINVDDGVAKLFEEFKAGNASHILSEQLNSGTIDTKKAAEILYVDDVTDLHTFEGFEQMQAEAPAASVIAVTLTDIKPINDSVAGGHGVSDALLRHVSPAIAAADPLAARKGTNFVIRGDATTLAQVLKDVQARLPKGMHGAGGVGADAKSALEAMDKTVDAGRASGVFPAERADTHVKDFDQQLPRIEAAMAKAQEVRAAEGRSHRVKVTPSQLAAAAKLKAPEFFRLAFQDPKVPGVLSHAGWDRIPRKAHVASIDIKGLKAINAFGKDVGDRVLQLFAEVVRDFDGSDFDFAHLSGDEYAAQHDDPVKLQAWLDRIEVELTKRAVVVTQFGITKSIHAAFRAGIGEKSYGNADRVLNANKLEEKRRAAEAGVGGAAGQHDARAGGGVREGQSRAQVEAGRQLYEPRRAAPQSYVDPRFQGTASVGTGGSRQGDVSVSERGLDGGVTAAPVEEPAAPGTDFNPAELDAEIAADKAAAAAVATTLAERTAGGPERAQERAALEQGFNSREQVDDARAALARFRAKAAAAPEGKKDTKKAKAARQAEAETRVAERRAALEALLGWVENTGPGLIIEGTVGGREGALAVSKQLHRETELFARELGIIDPQSGLDSLAEDSLRGIVPKDMRRAKQHAPRTAAERARRDDQRAAFEKNVLGRTTLKQDTNGFTDIVTSGIEKVFRIGLTKKANKSTFLHESAHVFLDLFSDLSQRADAPQSVRDDWATTLKWLGVSQDEWSKMSLEQQTPFHEKWAKAFERYLAEGQYPTSRLAGAFQRFRLWMGTVYKQLTHLGEVNPEIKGVFDRLLATDEEIASQTEAMRLKALPMDALGMDIEEYSNHLDELVQATSHAREAVDFQVAKDQLRTTESWWKEAHREAQQEAADEYEGLRARVAQKVLRGEETHDFVVASPISLNRAEVEGWVGKERAKAFTLAADGVNADDVVEMYQRLGYETGRDLVEAIVALPSKEDFVDGRADQLMVERHPGVLDERTKLRELVSKGLHGDKTKSWLLKEIAALTARGTKAAPKMPLVAIIKRAAELMVAGRTVRELDINASQVAERKASSDAFKAAARGDYAQAAVLRQKQLLNMYVQDATREARKEVDAFEQLAAKLSTLKARQRLGKGHPTYRDTVDSLLATFGLAEAPQPLSGSLDALLAESERLMGENLDTVAFDRERILDRLKVVTVGPVWKALALEDVRHVNRALENLEAAAKNRATILLEGRRAEKEATVGELVASAETALERRPDEPTTEAETTRQAMGRRWNQFDGGLLKVETMARWLAGAKDTADFVKSTWFKAIIEPMQKAKTLEGDLFRKHLAPLIDAWKAIPSDTKSRWMERFDGRKYFPNHIAEKLPQRRFEVLMMLLHSGNESNLQRLTEGRGITEAELRAAAVAVGVTKEEYSWLQTIWDTAEGLKPLAFDLEEADSGVRPDAIPARAFDTPHGRMAGGYFPAVYDRIAAVGKKQEASLAGFSDPSYTRPATSHGFLKKRSEGFTDIISLSPASIQRHFVQVVHDVSHRQAIRSVGTLLLDDRVQRVLRERLGSGRAEQFMQWVGDVARMRGASTADGLGFLNGLASQVRGNIVVAVLGYKLPNAAEDFTSNLLSAVPASDLKAKHLAGAAQEFMAAPLEIRKLVLDKSGELRIRQGQVQRELAKQLKHLTEEGVGKLLNQGPIGWYKDHAFVFAEGVEVVTGTTIWLGAYRQALAVEGTSDAAAVTFADATVRQVMVSHSPVDLSTIMRNKGVIGHMLMFHGAFNHFYNQLRALQQDGRNQDTAKLIAIKSAKALALSVSLFVIGSLARGQGPDDGEPLEDWLFRKYALEGLMQLVPGGGEIGNVLANAQRGKITMARNNSLMGVAGSVTDSVLKAAKSEDPKQTAKAVAQILGPLTGVPTSAPMQVAGPLWDWVNAD